MQKRVVVLASIVVWSLQAADHLPIQNTVLNIPLLTPQGMYAQQRAPAVLQDCSICLEPVSQPVKPFTCSHSVDDRCIKPWIILKKQAATCPLCKAPQLGSTLSVAVAAEPVAREQVIPINTSGTRRVIICAAGSALAFLMMTGLHVAAGFSGVYNKL